MSKEAAGGGGKTDAENEEEEFVAIEVDGNGKPLDAPSKEMDDEDDASGLNGDTDEDEDDDPDAGDTRLGHSEDDELTDETPEARKERVKKERRARKIRNRVTQEARERLVAHQSKTILDQGERIAKLEGRSVVYDVRDLQRQLQSIEAQQTDAKATYSALLKANDHDGVAEVADIQATLREQHSQTLQMLQRAKAQAKKDGATDGGEDGEPAARPNGKGSKTVPQVDPEVKVRAEEWASTKPWLDPKKNPEDFAIVRAIDETLVREGMSPATDRYWTELTKRVARRLPERFKQRAAASTGNGADRGGSRVDDKGGQRPAGGPRMAAQTQSGARALGKNEVRVTPERKAAMIAAGKWEDPKKRNSQLAAYAKYDSEQA